MENNDLEIIKGHHKDFARAVVDLARTHKMGEINMTFRTNFLSGLDWQTVQMNWSEGRHGAKTKINLSAQTTISETME